VGMSAVSGVFKSRRGQKKTFWAISTVYWSLLVFVSWTTALEVCFALDDSKKSFSTIES